VTRFEREIERQRRRLTDTDERATGGIASRFERVRRTLASRTRALLDVVTRRRRKRQRTDSGWLHASEEFTALLADTTEQIVPFLAEALRLTEEGQGRMLERIIDILVSGVTSGRSVDLIAQDIANASGMTLSRASTIARTEIARARNEAQQAVMLTPESPIEEWVWHARLDACASCQSQHGSVHPITEILRSHPNDRCTMVPRMPSWAALGFAGVPDLRPRTVPGAERFASFDPAAQLAILGPGKYEAYRTGRITLADLVTHTHSERWGPGSREATLTEALA
jgi:uncharacterized protein YoaH (UPF0181 family)